MAEYTAKKFRLKPGQNIMFDVPEKYLPQTEAPAAPIPEEDFILESLPASVSAKPRSAGRKQCQTAAAAQSGTRKISRNTRRLPAKKRKERAFYMVLQSAMLALMLFSAGMIGIRIYAYVADSEHYNAIRNQYDIDFNKVVATPNREVPEYPLPTPERLTYPIPEGLTVETLQGLKAQNGDFQFWFYIEDTDISYYVMQSEDNDFYLRRNINKQFAYSGSLFLDYRNHPETLDGHSIIYGHNMQNNSMFGKLKNYREEEYFFNHRMIYTYSENEVTVWKVFSAYVTDTDNYYIRTHFTSDEDYLSFIQDFQNRSAFATEIQLTAQSDVLTLSTCHKTPENPEKGRFVVHAVKLGTCIIN